MEAHSPSRRALWAVAWANVTVHVLALALAALAMRPGTPGAPLDERLAFLARSPAGWTLGWGAWMLCAVADAAFLYVAAGYAGREGRLAALGVTVAVAGAAVDLVWDALHITVLPLAARVAVAGGSPPAPLFLVVERMAWAAGAVAANALYSAGTLLVTLALARARRIGGLALAAGVLTFAAGLALVAAGFTGAPRHLEIASVPTIAAFVVWTLATARDLARDLPPGAPPPARAG